MEEIDLDNIVGSRTRGKEIDYAQAAKDFPEEEDEEDEDDEDFEVRFYPNSVSRLHFRSSTGKC